MTGHRVGYMRVSTLDQKTVRQLDDVDRVFEDPWSGKDLNLLLSVTGPSGSSPANPWCSALPLPLPAVAEWSDAVHLLELAGEVEGVGVASCGTYRSDGQFGGVKQFAGPGHAQLCLVLQD